MAQFPRFSLGYIEKEGGVVFPIMEFCDLVRFIGHELWPQQHKRHRLIAKKGVAAKKHTLFRSPPSNSVYRGDNMLI